MNEYEQKWDRHVGMVRLLCKSYESAKRARPMAFDADRKKRERDEITSTLQKVKDSGGKAFKERDMGGWLEMNMNRLDEK